MIIRPPHTVNLESDRYVSSVYGLLKTVISIKMFNENQFRLFQAVVLHNVTCINKE